MIQSRHRRVLRHTLDHRRCGEDRHAVMCPEQLGHFSRIKAAAFRDDLAGPGGSMGEDVAARTMGHRRRMEDGILGRYLIDVDEVRERHGEQVLVGQHRSFRPAGRAAGIEKPGNGLGRNVGQGYRLALVKPVGAAHLDDLLHGLDLVGQWHRHLGEIRCDEADPGAGMVEDVGDFPLMQFGVHWHHGQPGIPAGDQHFEVSGAVLHHECCPITRLKAEPAAHMAGDHGCPFDQLGMVQEDALPLGKGGEVRKRPAVSDKERGDIHRAAQSIPRRMMAVISGTANSLATWPREE